MTDCKPPTMADETNDDTTDEPQKDTEYVAVTHQTYGRGVTRDQAIQSMLAHMRTKTLDKIDDDVLEFTVFKAAGDWSLGLYGFEADELLERHEASLPIQGARQLINLLDEVDLVLDSALADGHIEEVEMEPDDE